MSKYDFIVYKTTDLTNGKIYIGYDSYNRSNYYGSGIYFLNNLNLSLKLYVESIIKEEFEEDKNYRNYYKITHKYNYIIPLLFTKEILARYDTMKEMVLDEPNWIKKFNATNHDIGYNIIDTPTWGDTFTNNPNKEKRKMQYIEAGKRNSINRKGIKFTSSWIENIRNAAKGKQNNIRKYIIQTPENDIIEIITKKKVMELIGCSGAFFDRKSYKKWKLINVLKLNNEERNKNEKY